MEVIMYVEDDGNDITRDSDIEVVISENDEDDDNDITIVSFIVVVTSDRGEDVINDAVFCVSSVVDDNNDVTEGLFLETVITSGYDDINDDKECIAKILEVASDTSGVTIMEAEIPDKDESISFGVRICVISKNDADRIGVSDIKAVIGDNKGGITDGNVAKDSVLTDNVSGISCNEVSVDNVIFERIPEDMTGASKCVVLTPGGLEDKSTTLEYDTFRTRLDVTGNAICEVELMTGVEYGYVVSY